MPPARLNNSFVHGVAAYSAYALGPFIQSMLSPILACLLCVYAGWFHRAHLASFLGGVIIAVASWTAVAILTSPEIGVGAFIMVPVGLMVILPTALAGYLVGKVVFKMANRKDKNVGGDR